MFGILNPGEEVIVPTPGFGLYETIATVAGARTVKLDISKTGFQIDGDALNAAITDKTKAIVINSPCNCAIRHMLHTVQAVDEERAAR